MSSPDPAAGNLGTTTRQITDDLHALFDQDRVWRAITNSLRFHFKERLFFSDRTFEFALTVGRSGYSPGDGFGLPGDLQEIVGNRMKLWYGGQESQAQPVHWLSNEEFDSRREWDTTPGTPDGWTFSGNRLRLIPTPNSAADILTAPYVVNLGIPRFVWNGSGYDWFAPDGATLTNAFTNDWLQVQAGEESVRMRACYDLLRSARDPEAQTFLAAWLEARSRLEDETEGKRSGGRTSLTLRLF